jgi:transcription-repair coupling factor (superfamily II helicase)
MELKRINKINNITKNRHFGTEMESRFFKNQSEWHWFLQQAGLRSITEDEAEEITSVKLTLGNVEIEEILFESIN